MMSETTQEYAVISSTLYFGPRSTQELVSRGYDSPGEARAAVKAYNPDWDRLGHNQAAATLGLAVRIITTIDPTDWQSWPSEMFDAAIEAVREAGIDPEDSEAIEESEADWADLAAAATGHWLVHDDEYDEWLLCGDTWICVVDCWRQLWCASRQRQGIVQFLPSAQ